MSVLDENVPESQRRLLKKWRIPARQIGLDVGRKGMEDDEVVPLLLRLDRPTFFTLDADFYDRRLCHARYCLAHLDVEDDEAARQIRRLLRHRSLDAKAKRVGRVIRASPNAISFWRLHEERESRLAWV